MADNNVFILFEEIKTALKGINGKLEELPNVAIQQSRIITWIYLQSRRLLWKRQRLNLEKLRAYWISTGRHTHRFSP